MIRNSAARQSSNYCMFLVEVLVLVLFTCLPTGYGDNAVFETCSAQGNATCAADNHRCVIKLTGNGTIVEEKCDSCAPGYIPGFKDKTKCIRLGLLDYKEYFDKYKPNFFESFRTLLDRHGRLQRSAQEISDHNSQFPPPSFVMGFNELSAYTKSELQRRNGYKRNSTTNETEFPFLDSIIGIVAQENNLGGRALTSIPKAINWVERGAVTSVKDQGNCGCCWSVAAIGAVEGRVAIDSNMAFRKSLSFQQLISCDVSNAGCNGGQITNALTYIDSNRFGGVASYNQYPFADSFGWTSFVCNLFAKQLAVAISKPVSATTFSSPSTYSQRLLNMKTALATGGPVSVLMKADCSTLYNYASGVIDNDGDCACNQPDCLDHAVLMVGYNDTADIPYFLLKNSWSTGWGESGYFRVAQKAPSRSTFGLFGLLAQGTLPSRAENKTADIYSGATASLGYNWAGIVGAGMMMVMGLVL